MKKQVKKLKVVPPGMNIITLSAQNGAPPLILEPTEDTLYLLPSNSLQVELKLTIPHVRAFVLGLFHTTQNQELTIHQHHLAPHTESHVLLKSIVSEQGNFFYQGNLLIEKAGTGSTASQEARGLLLGTDARFKAVPSLEILPKDVVCHHKASSTPLNADSLYTLETKGLDQESAGALLQQAFLQGASDTLALWGINPEDYPDLKDYMMMTQNT